MGVAKGSDSKGIVERGFSGAEKDDNDDAEPFLDAAGARDGANGPTLRRYPKSPRTSRTMKMTRRKAPAPTSNQRFFHQGRFGRPPPAPAPAPPPFPPGEESGGGGGDSCAAWLLLITSSGRALSASSGCDVVAALSVLKRQYGGDWSEEGPSSREGGPAAVAIEGVLAVSHMSPWVFAIIISSRRRHATRERQKGERGGGGRREEKSCKLAPDIVL